MNHVYHGDNLTVLRDSIKDASVDLIYLDPPFNSNAIDERQVRFVTAFLCKKGRPTAKKCSTAEITSAH